MSRRSVCARSPRSRSWRGRSAGAEPPHETRRLVPERDDLVAIVTGRRLVRREIEAALERPERDQQTAGVDRLRRPYGDGFHDRRELGKHLRLRSLLGRDQREHRFHFGYRCETFERCRPFTQLVERPGRRERDEARPAGRAEDALLPIDRLGASCLEVQEVVVEPHAVEREDGERGRHAGEREHEPRPMGHGVDEAHAGMPTVAARHV